jgi:hypothetical protein
MAWTNIDGNILNLDEVVLLTERLGQEEPVPGDPDAPSHPLLVTVHMRGGASFTLKGKMAMDFTKFFIACVATDAVAWDRDSAPGSTV